MRLIQTCESLLVYLAKNEYLQYFNAGICLGLIQWDQTIPNDTQTDLWWFVSLIC